MEDWSPISDLLDTQEPRPHRRPTSSGASLIAAMTYGAGFAIAIGLAILIFLGGASIGSGLSIMMSLMLVAGLVFFAIICLFMLQVVILLDGICQRLNRDE